MKLFLICFLLFISLPSQAQKRISFIEEYIDFTIDTSRFEINGIFVFSNSTGQTAQQNILFPLAFGTDSIKSIRVYNLSYNEKVDYKFMNRGILFKIEVKPKDTVSLNIAYTQPVKKENTYILRSTDSWGEPIKRAKYSLTLLDALVIERLSYPPDSISDSVLFWEKKDFLPEKDFVIILN